MIGVQKEQQGRKIRLNTLMVVEMFVGAQTIELGYSIASDKVNSLDKEQETTGESNGDMLVLSYDMDGRVTGLPV